MTTLPIAIPANFRIIAHRGASAYMPENTLAAFQLALEMGVPNVETDVQLTTDGTVVLCHDLTLARYGHGDQVVEELAWADLTALDMGSWFSPHLHRDQRLITLDRLFAHFGDQLIYHVELKGRAPSLAAATHAIITKHGLAENCFITSFAYDWLVAMHEIDPSLRMGWLVRKINDDVLAKAEALHLYQLCPFAGTITRDAVEHARQIVTEVRAWGLLGDTILGQAAEVQQLIHNLLDAGCDGMTINWPDWVQRR